MTYLVTGDKHGRFDELLNALPHMSDVAVIVLGDAGVNFYLNKTDRKLKQKLQDSGYLFYLVRGNHEQRPELIEGITKCYDDDINNYVYQEPDFPSIRYLIDGEEYSFNGHSALVIGGAYSVDKWYRLSRCGCSEDMDETYVAKRAGWFKHEQLTYKEMMDIIEKVHYKSYDFVLTHTCPLSWEPRDLFLKGLDQDRVDKSMESWLDAIRDSINYRAWLFGHYHSDRIERPCVEQFFHDVEDIETIWQRWTSDKELDW